MKKRWIALLLACMMCVGLAACSSDDGGNTSNPGSTNSSAPSNNDNQNNDNQGGGEALTLDDVWPQGSTVYFDVPAKAGGGTDLFTRYLTQALQEVCPGVNFVVQNYETSEVGVEHTKNADPDGMTLVANHGGGIVLYMTGASNVSMKDDLKVVGVMNLGGPQAIIAGPNAPYHNLNELGDYIKNNPGEVVIGCALGGTTQMIFVNLVDALTGDSSMANYVQCGSEADKLTQTASGSIDIANCSIPNALAYEADGRLTILGTIGPDISTLATMNELLGEELPDTYKSGPEQGIDSAVWNSSYYLMVPASTPDNICEAINSAIMKASEMDSYIEGHKAMATFVGTLDYEESKKTLETEWNFLDTLIDDMGLKVEGR